MSSDRARALLAKLRAIEVATQARDIEAVRRAQDEARAMLQQEEA